MNELIWVAVIFLIIGLIAGLLLAEILEAAIQSRKNKKTLDKIEATLESFGKDYTEALNKDCDEIKRKKEGDKHETK